MSDKPAAAPPSPPPPPPQPRDPETGGSEPSSHETCGQFPYQEVRETFPGSAPDPQ
jgi:hypothetical protein